MTLLIAQPAAATGTDATYTAAAAGGDTIAPAAGLVLHVKNGDAAAKTVTLVRPGTQYGQANPDIAVVIAASPGNQFIRVPPEFADPATGLVNVTYSAVTSVTVALLQAQ